MQNRPYTLLENTSLALAILMFGIMAGFFWTYTFNVNLATAQLDGASYARVQSLFNVNVRHAMFFSFFFGSAVVAVLALILNYRHYRNPSFWLLASAAILYIVGIILFTKFVNLPLNYYTESWNPEFLPSDWEATRQSWNKANAWRVLISFLAFALSLLALVGRSMRAS
ncbi:Uncharacterized membrane protein [Thiothrix eikelboomii]|uniref:Uncharacterized membrane protein n=1 Tax=Thiothrix eikelboomii TaxID=92487 RepID=A0A1T4X9V2_9GAMM|nr:DUF1772 domain-containing protein [Thiothrix eikelboomii]SKA86279.1 Uncharacterized membrane protein [Thiothrix eikelboomii]